MSTDLRKEVWSSMLDADMNARYWKYLVERYSKRETYLKILLAITTSGAVIWGIWVQQDVTLKFLSSFSALLAIVMPILNYSKKIDSMSELAGKWSELLIEYDDIWSEVNNNPDSSTLERTYKKFRTIQISLAEKERKMPNEMKLIRKCYEEVKQSRDLN